MKRETRFAHSEGITDVEVTPDGKSIITCGDEDEIRVWSGFDDDDPVSFSATDSCFAVAFAKNRVIVSTGSNKVETYEFPRGKFIEDKLRFTGAVNHVHVSADGKFVVAGSADTTYQLASLEETTDPPIKVNAHSAPVLSVSIDPQKEFIATSGCDGHVCIWSFSKPQQLIKRWSQVFPASNDITTSPTLCRMAWHPLLGKQLAVPEKEKIKIYARDTWDEFKVLSSTKLTKFFSVVCYSKCGSIIAAGGTDGTVAIWDGFTYAIKAQTRDANHITGLVFHPEGKILLGADSQGKLLSMQDFSSGSDTEEAEPNSQTQSQSDEPKAVDDALDDGMDALFDDDGDNEISVSKIKAQMGFVSDEFGNDSYVGPKKQPESILPTVDIDDSASVMSEASSKMARPPPSLFNPFTVPQKPFQPASTPEHLEHRFMVWNSVGIIRSNSSQDEEFDDDGIDIEFHDAAFHHAIRMRNQADYNIGNLSTEVVVLAAPKTAEAHSKIFCQHFSTWDMNKEWTLDLPKPEEVTGIALGAGWIAVATSINRLRILSVAGVQKYIYDLPGTIVAISGHEEFIFVTYHNGVGINGDQSISYSLFKLSFNSSKLTPLVHEASLPLSKGSTLSWIGFSDEGTPVFSDSKDVLRLLNGRMWTPLCDMRDQLSGINDHFWVVGVSETESHVRAVKCKGAKFPPTLPRPTIMMLDMKIPLCEMDTQKSQLEDVMLQSFLLAATTRRMERKGYDMEQFQDEADSKANEKLMRLFLLFCNSEKPREFRAHEYVAMMPTSKAVQLAIKGCSKLPRGVSAALKERLQAIGRKKLRLEEDGAEDENDDFEAAHIVTHIEHRMHSNSDGDGSSNSFFNGRSSSPPKLSSQLSVLADNPLFQKQKEELRSVMGSLRSNPFRKSQSNANNGTATTPTGDKNSQLLDDSQSQDPLDSNGASKGMSKIDVWRKPAENKQNSLPEFNPKDPNRKSLGKTKKVAEGKKNVKDGGSKETAAPRKQRSVFEMLGNKSKPDLRESQDSNPASPLQNSDSIFQDSQDGVMSEMNGKRKRFDMNDCVNSEKKSRTEVDADEDE